jgi:antitoxin YobK
VCVPVFLAIKLLDEPSFNIRAAENMSGIDLKELEKLIASRPDVIDFGCEKDAVDQAWVVKAEATLNRPLSNSYKWFLNKYSGGEIGGEEIFSLYGRDFESVNGGDIVFQHRLNRKNYQLNSKWLVVSKTDFGEIFYFDYNYYRDNECPIYVRLPSGSSEKYASNFYEFLKKRVDVHLCGIQENPPIF